MTMLKRPKIAVRNAEENLKDTVCQEILNVGKDEEGLQFLKDYDEYVKIRMKALDKELSLCNSKPAVRLAPVIFICSVCEIEGFNSSTGVFKHVERVHGQNILQCRYT